jgi:hypothetical protein
MADGSGSTSQSQPRDADSQSLHIADNFPSSESGQGPTSSLGEPSSYVSQTVFYGTNINVPAVAGEIRTFIHKFSEDPDVQPPLYLRKIEEMALTEVYNLNLVLQHLFRSDRHL